MLFWISIAFYGVGWGLSLIWGFPRSGRHHFVQQPPAIFNLASSFLFLAVWLATRRGALPLEVLKVIDAAATVLAAWLLLGMELVMPLVFRPELMVITALLALLLYRAAIVPSGPARTARISALAALPLPFATAFIYGREARPPESPATSIYVVYAALWSVVVVLLPTAIARVIYGLRRTVREARRLGQYTLVEKIGEGGMGAVYRARHALLRRPTTIKLLPPERAGQIDLARFEREVQLTSLLTSAHTVSVYDYGRTPDGVFYYAMEYLDGVDLDELVRRDGPMAPARVAHVLRQVCRALEEAHRIGLIHRDIKPANILLCERGGTPDVAKVVDFGLVKDVGSGRGAGLTVENTVPGTPYFMAPESLTSPDRVDARSDLYSLAATAYFLLCGRIVFEGSTIEVFGHILRTPPVPPSERLGRPLPRKISDLVLAGLSKDAGARPESARAFGEALDACDDMPRWTEEEAAAWWRTRGAALKRAVTEEAPTVSPPRTLVVDWMAPR